MTRDEALELLPADQREAVESGEVEMRVLAFNPAGLASLKRIRAHLSDKAREPSTVLDTLDLNAKMASLHELIGQCERHLAEPLVILYAPMPANTAQAGFTPTGDMPPYLNATRHENGTVTITVRGPPEAGGDYPTYGETASINLSDAEFASWKADLERLVA